MAAFDTVFAPRALAPTDTAAVTLFTAGTDSASGQDVSVLVDVANISTGHVKVRVGITPSGGSPQWKVYDTTLYADDPILALGPWFLRSGDLIRVRVDTADTAVFSVTGLESS